MPLSRRAKAAVGRAVYPAAAWLTRWYLMRGPIRRGKPAVLDLWLRYMNWRRNYAVTATSGRGIRFRLRTFDSVSVHIFLTGVWESGITELMVSSLRPGDAFVDVGANIGYHSLTAAALVGPAGRVIAIEPAPYIRAMFEENLALNPRLAARRNIELVPYCATEEAGVVTLSAWRGGNSGETTLRKLGGDAIAIDVEARPLDELLEGRDLSRCPLLKMDIEGAECAALAGAERTLDRYPSIALMLEVDDRYLRELGHSARDLVTWFQRRDYRAYTIVAPRANLTGAPLELRPLERVPEDPQNVLFTREPGRFERWIAPSRGRQA